MDCRVLKKDFGQKAIYLEEIIVFCDGDLSKIGHHLKKSVSKIKVILKTSFTKKCAPKLISFK